MNLSKFFKIVAALTLLALVYIHLQMQIIDLAYQGKSKEEKIKKLIEENGNLNYSILKLKSANNLGIKMFSDNSKMRFAAPQNIVKLRTKSLSQVASSKSKRNLTDKKNSLVGLLAWEDRAEARSR